MSILSEVVLLWRNGKVFMKLTCDVHFLYEEQTVPFFVFSSAFPKHSLVTLGKAPNSKLR